MFHKIDSDTVVLLQATARGNPGQLNVYKCHPASVLFEPSEQMYIVQASIGSGQLALPRMRGVSGKLYEKRQIYHRVIHYLRARSLCLL